MATPASQPPIPLLRLKEITSDACEAAIGSAVAYEHSKTEEWNTTIINTILKSLISESSNTSGASSSAPAFKYAVNSTIIQHLVPTSALSSSNIHSASVKKEGDEKEPTTKSEATSTDGKPHVGRRGMHSATGAYWNEKTDGMWSYKYEGGESKGLDVVISVIWIGI